MTLRMKTDSQQGKAKIPPQTIRIIAGHLSGTNSSRQEEQFSVWLSEPGNDKLFTGFQKIWNEMEAGSDTPFDCDSAWTALSERISASGLSCPSEQRIPDIDKRRTETSEPKKSSPRIRRIFLSSGIAAAVALAAVLGYNLRDGSGEMQFASVSGKSLVTLPDGSEVTLDNGSTLRCGTSFGNGSRQVSSSGRAFFHVAKDRHRPFVIDAGGLEVKVLGTKFGLDSGHDRVRISLIEGSVSLTSKANGESLTISKGEIATFDRAGGSLKVERGDVHDELIWCSDRLSFVDATLDEVCRKLSLWYGVNVLLSDSLYGKGRITFTITDESLDEVLSIIGKTTRTSYRFESPKSILIY